MPSGTEVAFQQAAEAARPRCGAGATPTSEGAWDVAVQVREAGADDGGAIERLGHVIQDAHAAALPDLFQAGVAPVPAHRLPRLLADDALGALVAEHDGAIAGYAIVELLPSTRAERAATLLPTRPRVLRRAVRRFGGRVLDRGPASIMAPRRVAHLDTVVVAPEHRGSGAGVALVNACMAWAAERGATDFDLEVYEFNTSAIELYRRLGFEVRKRTMARSLAPRGGAAGHQGDVASDERAVTSTVGDAANERPATRFAST